MLDKFIKNKEYYKDHIEETHSDIMAFIDTIYRFSKEQPIKKEELFNNIVYCLTKTLNDVYILKN